MNSSHQHVSPPGNTGFKSRVVAAGLLATLGILALPADVSVALWAKSTHPPKELMGYLDLAEVFGHGIGVTMIMIGTFCLDRSIQFPSIRWPAIRWPTFQPTTKKRFDAVRV